MKVSVSYPEVVEKQPLNLMDLPNDELIIILSYIPPADKKNLKLASRTCEQRVLELDPDMNTWHLDFDFEESISQCFELAEAKRRHTDDGTFNYIKLKVDFNCANPGSILAADSILNHWKDNIIDLGMENLCGAEIFMTFPSVKLEKLQSLGLHSKTYKTVEKEEKVKLIASTFVNKHHDTLEILAIRNLSFDIQKPLKLKQFSANNTDYNAVLSVLKKCSNTLEDFQWFEQKQDTDNQPLSCPALKLKKFTARKINFDQAAAVIKACKSTLLHLSLNQLVNISVKSLELASLDQELINPGMRLEKLEVERCPHASFSGILNASQAYRKKN